MLALQIVSATALVSMAFLSWRGYIRESRRLRKLQEKMKYGEIIERRINVLARDNNRVIQEYSNTGKVDIHATQLLAEENRELEEMIKKYEKL